MFEKSITDLCNLNTDVLLVRHTRIDNNDSDVFFNTLAPSHLRVFAIPLTNLPLFSQKSHKTLSRFPFLRPVFSLFMLIHINYNITNNLLISFVCIPSVSDLSVVYVRLPSLPVVCNPVYY